MESKFNVRLKWLDLGSSNRMPPPFNFENLLEIAWEKLEIHRNVFKANYRIFYTDAFDNIEDIDNDV